MMILIIKEIIIIRIYIEQDNFGAPDNNDGMDINNINKNQKLHLITQNIITTVGK